MFLWQVIRHQWGGLGGYRGIISLLKEELEATGVETISPKEIQTLIGKFIYFLRRLRFLSKLIEVYPTI